MKIVSYNLNGIRAALKKDLLGWLEATQPDIFCVQESKANEDQVDITGFEALGYKAYWNGAEKKGYSGVVVFTKLEPKSYGYGFGVEKFDREGRVVKVDFEGWSLINSYFPSGSSGEVRHQYKMEYLEAIKSWIDEVRKDQPNLIVVGDYNIVHTELDIHNPQRKDKPSGYKPDERAWLDRWFNEGFVDAYRKMHPEEVTFSWWTYRMGARSRNKGWRIDYAAVTDGIASKITHAYQDNDAVHSDHCPVVLEIDL